MHITRPIIPMRFTRFCLAVGTLSSLTALSLGGQAAWADSTCTPPANGPTGPDAATFSYQCDGTYAGEWTNSYYVYDPTTSAQTALYSPDYSYDCTTGTWTKAEWDYSASTGGYVENRIAATAPPDQPTNCSTVDSTNNTNANAGSGSAITTPATSPDNPSPASSNTAGSTAAATAPPDPSASCTVPTAVPDTSAPAPTSANSSVTLNNGVCSTAQSGDASVTDNRSAGDATSGNATTEVDAANLVESTSTSGNGTLTFTKDIKGNVNGNLVLDPSVIGASSAGNAPGNNVGTVNTDASINNAITATAVSGDATVSGNGKGGDATSGDAEAIVNLINMINSAIAAGQSFVGTINIYGNLNGNILIPQSVIDQLLASNAASGSGSGSSDFNSNESITNNVNANATSGAATVSDNNIGGNATSGNAKTNVTIMNLTGSSIVGKNVLLVFVNVLGQWVGMILNAPAGATSAEFGGGITSSTAGTGSNIVEADANLSITNNVNASAASGNATVANNWMGGNATSGNASTAVNILNVEDSTLSLANWFGILFINVFGTWNGNFGIQPTATPTVPSGGANGGSTTSTGTHSSHQHTAPHRFATFVASAAAVATTTAGDASGVLGDTVSAPISHQVADSTLPASNNDAHANYVLPALGLFLAILLLAGAERDRLLRRKG